MSSPSEIKILAHAKINLALDITGRREDGYHLLDMINRTVDHSDELTLSLARNGGISICSNAQFLPRDERNHVYKAILCLEETLGRTLPPLHIYIKKRIPTQAGLGGGSADAAAALIALNRLFDLKFSAAQLSEIGLSVGSDVPFCLTGGAARVQGIGELIQPIPDRCEYSVVITMPQWGHSTRDAFAAIDGCDHYARPDTQAMIGHLAAGDVSGMAISLCNVFQTAGKYPETERLVSLLLCRGALGASMSGSGAAVFGIFKNHLDARRCCGEMRRRGLRAFAARPVDAGSRIVYVR